MVRAAQEAVLQRPNFAIDAIGDSDGEDDEEEVEDDSGVMDEVRPTLSRCLLDDEIGNELMHVRWKRSSKLMGTMMKDSKASKRK